MKLVQTKDYLLLIDEEVVCKTGELYLTSIQNRIIPKSKGVIQAGDKIIAYYPLTKEVKELDLLLLPPFEGEVDINKLADKESSMYVEKYTSYKHESYMYNECKRIFKEGYKAAQSKQFTLEDIRKAHRSGFNRGSSSFPEDFLTEDEYIQSLSTQQLPKEFIPEYQKDWGETTKMFMESMGDNPEDFKYEETLKTTTNSEGKEVLVGIYKY